MYVYIYIYTPLRHCCLFAYGQTGSGKTHTVFGDPSSDDSKGVAFRSLVRENGGSRWPVESNHGFSWYFSWYFTGNFIVFNSV